MAQLHLLSKKILALNRRLHHRLGTGGVSFARGEPSLSHACPWGDCAVVRHHEPFG